MKHLKSFKTHADYEAFAESVDYIEPNVSYCEDADDVHYNKPAGPEPEPKIKALKFTSPNECTLGIMNAMGGSFDVNAQYSTDAQTWTDWDGTAVSFGNGTELYVRGNNPSGWNYFNIEMDGVRSYSFTMEGSNVSVEGNIMHLLSYTEDLNTLPCNGCFGGLFMQCNALVDASKLELPATTLTEFCYSGMFNGCSSLVNAPELPATTLANNCYDSMFVDCTSLVNAPELPATTLANNCYQNMFYGCTSLVNAPSILPATILAESCYQYMFNTCTSLVNAPELPATTLADGCYSGMFEYCESLNHIKMLATDISAKYCLSSWTYDVSSTGTFECASGMSTKIPSGSHGIPDGWTVTEVI